MKQIVEEIRRLERDRDEWKAAHRRLAEMLNATTRGRDHADAIFIINALKRSFGIVGITVTQDASTVRIETADGRTYVTAPTSQDTMKKKPRLTNYDVRITRTIEHRATIEGVLATSPEEAIKKAIAIADGPTTRAWREGDVINQEERATPSLAQPPEAAR